MTFSDQQLSLPEGFLLGGVHAGLKDDPQDLDLSLILSKPRAKACGVFTQNHFPGEPVKLAKKRLEGGVCSALLINSRYSNVATGEEGMNDALRVCGELADQLELSEEEVLISSTGIIGRRYPAGVMDRAFPKLLGNLGTGHDQFMNAARGIMTTDTHPKAFSEKIGAATISVMVKGSGMIDPNMATMLAFIMTDADLPPEQMKPMLKRVADRSFNNLSIDFDTSTSDSCFLLSNGLAGEVVVDDFEEALTEVCLKASRALVLDGEGVTHLIDCQVKGGADNTMARKVAESIVNSPLVKTMITGADPNWGRLIMAIGKTQDPRLEGVAPTLKICEEKVLQKGVPFPHDLRIISDRMRSEDQVLLEIDLHLGDSSLNYLGANLTKEYVSINADYTT